VHGDAPAIDIAADTTMPVPALASTAMSPPATAEAAVAPRPRTRPVPQAAVRPLPVSSGETLTVETPTATSTVTEVVVARSMPVRDREAAVSRTVAGSVVQVSPAGPNRAAVYVAHPTPVPTRPLRGRVDADTCGDGACRVSRTD
jgi:hypothetical protein